jgi:hypothetical protein
VADFNEDGNPDIVISQTDSSRVAILFGRGDGTFPSRSLISLADAPQIGATGDLNGDGHVDLVFATASGVTVLLGRGDGTFLPAQSYPTLAQPAALRLADLDEDGRPDLIFPDEAGRALHVLWQNAQGGFAPESAFATRGNGPDAVVIGDFNHDGHLDVATSDYGYAVYGWYVSVFLGTGSRSLAPVTGYNANVNPVTVSAADLDGNGSTDLLSAGDLGGFTILINRGDGTFDRLPFGTGVGQDGLSDATLVDLDGDGSPDFAATTANGVLVARGLGGGQFAPADTLIAAPTQRTIVASDLNHDTRPDLVTTGWSNTTSRGVTVLLNQTPTVSAAPGAPALAFDAPRPNPVRHGVAFEFSLPEDGQTSLTVYDLAGRLVTTLASGVQTGGAHRAYWDLRARNGRHVASGIYFARLRAGTRELVRRVEVLR